MPRRRGLSSSTRTRRVVSYDGKTRKNCVYRDGVLYGIFNSGTFRYGLLTVERHYWIEDADFDDGKWDYGDVYKTNIIIK